MKPELFCDVAGRLLRCPTAPYHEAWVRAEVEQICAQHGLQNERDAFGNVFVRVGADLRQRPLVLAAHMDHPGFQIVRPLSKTRWIARFLGGVPARFFRRGISLRLMPGALPGTLGKKLGSANAFEVQINHAVALPQNPGAPASRCSFAVWDLEDFAVRRGRIHGRACDDLIGVAAVLATMIELKQTRARVNVIGVISRAEEIGFLGALTVAAANVLPKNSLIISLETSRELPPAKMGKGVIIRVGDRTSIFDGVATRFLTEVAAGLSAGSRSFRWQRALMSGGTCEATAYQEFGFQTAAVCIALGNYHNCAARGRIAAEFVSITDACGMVNLLVEAAKRSHGYAGLVGKLPARLKRMLADARRELKGG